MGLKPRQDDDENDVHPYADPQTEMNIGLWMLFAGATCFLMLRLWCKVTRRHGWWYDDYILISAWVVLAMNNSLITYEFATGYVLKDSSQQWDDRMHILINISSCGTLIGQAWTKTAFGVTLLRISNRWQSWALWFCIISMNSYNLTKCLFQWAKICGDEDYQDWYRLDFCLDPVFRDDFKEGGNVYNIIMDFILASFPWLIVRSLEMKRVEKIGLCVTMSLGTIVAIISAIRTEWKFDGNDRDYWYIWRNGMSQVWYSSEITGTIMVQCIPVLRPLCTGMRSTMASIKLSSTADALSATLVSKFSSQRASAGPSADNNELGPKDTERIALREIPEEPTEDWKEPVLSLSPVEDYHHAIASPRTPFSPGDRHSSRSDMWPLAVTEAPGLHRPDQQESWEVEHDEGHSARNSFDAEQFVENGLSPPSHRPAQ